MAIKMVTVKSIGSSDPMDDPRELVLLIDAMHKTGRQVEVQTRYSLADLTSKVIPNYLWIRTAMDKADQLTTLVTT